MSDMFNCVCLFYALLYIPLWRLGRGLWLNKLSLWSKTEQAVFKDLMAFLSSNPMKEISPNLKPSVEIPKAFLCPRVGQ